LKIALAYAPFKLKIKRWGMKLTLSEWVAVMRDKNYLSLALLLCFCFSFLGIKFWILDYSAPVLFMIAAFLSRLWFLYKRERVEEDRIFNKTKTEIIEWKKQLQKNIFNEIMSKSISLISLKKRYPHIEEKVLKNIFKRLIEDKDKLFYDIKEGEAYYKGSIEKENRNANT
jgi:hypothetical protein